MFNCKRKRWLEDQILCNVVVCSFTANRLLEHRSTWKSTSLAALELTANPFITPAIQFSASQKFLSFLLSSADLIQIFTTLKGKDHHTSIRVLVVQCTQPVGLFPLIVSLLVCLPLSPSLTPSNIQTVRNIANFFNSQLPCRILGIGKHNTKGIAGITKTCPRTRNPKLNLSTYLRNKSYL